MHFLSALGCYSTHPPRHFLIVRGWLENSDTSLPFCPDHPTNALWGTNLDCMMASPVERCYCLPENPVKLLLHVVEHCPAVKSHDVAAREGLQWGEGSPPCTLLLSYCPLQQSAVILPCMQCFPRS